MSTIEYRGELVKLPPDDELSRRLEETGEWEPEVTAYIQENVPRGATCVDMGAHIGIHTIDLRLAAGATGRVVSLEPHPHTFVYLQGNVTKWSNVEPYQVGVSSRTGIRRFGVVRNMDIVTMTEETEEGFKAPVVGPNFFGNVDVVKMDIEGEEENVLPALNYMNFDHLIVEFHDYAYPEFVKEDLKKCLETTGNVTYSGRTAFWSKE